MWVDDHVPCRWLDAENVGILIAIIVVDELV
jgi:hypothetical protein